MYLYDEESQRYKPTKYGIVITLDVPCEVMYGMERRSDRPPGPKISELATISMRKIEVEYDTEEDREQVFNHMMKLIDVGENVVYVNDNYILTNHIVMVEKVVR